MSISVLLGTSIFLLGAAVGALSTRLQWRAFKQKVSQEMLEQLAAEPSIHNDRRSLQIKYARWFSPNRALKPH